MSRLTAITIGRSGWGAGVTALQNEKGVVIELKSATKGAELKIALEGLKLALDK